MSLEAALDRNTEALNRLMAMMASPPPQMFQHSADAAFDPPLPEPATEGPEPTQSPTQSVQPPAEVKYSDIQALAQTIPAAHKRPVLLKVAAEFGVQKFEEVKAEQFPALYAALQQAIAEVAS